MQIDRNIVTKRKRNSLLATTICWYIKKRKKYVFKNDKAKKNGWHDMNPTTPTTIPLLRKG